MEIILGVVMFTLIVLVLSGLILAAREAGEFRRRGH
jgi:Na+-transporting NADH:ubiquinone oxidoreductase subunit NqrF